MKWFHLQCMVLFFLFTALPAFAGVVVEDQDGTVTFFSSGRLKTTDEEMDIIFDVNKGILTMINNKEKNYTSGPVEEYCRSVQAARDRAMAEMSAEEKRMLEAFMGGGEKEAPPKVRIEKSGRGEKIAGYTTTLYTVYMNGEKYEELHLSDDVPVFDEVDPVKMSKLVDRFSECMMSAIGLGGTSVEEDPAYKKLMRKQYPMKSVEFDGGRAEDTDQVARMEKKSIPESKFNPPAGYAKKEFQSFLEQSAQSSGDSSDSEAYGGFQINEEEMPPMEEDEPYLEEEMAEEENSISSHDRAEEEPKSLEEEIGGQIKEGLKSIFGGF